MDNPRRILIVLIAGIGDLVLASKAIRSISNAKELPICISLLTSSEASILAQAYPYFKKVYAFPIRELRKKKSHLLDIARLVNTLRLMAFDKIVNLYLIGSKTGALKMGLLFSLLKAEVKIGLDRHGFGRFLTDSVQASTFEDQHVVDAMQDIALRAGGIPNDQGIEVFWNPVAESKWSPFFDGIERKFVIGINPGGDRANRRWAPDRFAAVAARLVERFDARIVLLGGPGDRDIASSIVHAIPSGVSNLSGTIPLDELPYVISRLDLMVTNDSGPMHIAAATKTPLVALFGPEDPRLFGPYTTPDLYRIIMKDVPCRPCGNKKCTAPLCLDGIHPDEVLDACLDMLQHHCHR
jgi:heptosyltransferase-2